MVNLIAQRAKRFHYSRSADPMCFSIYHQLGYALGMRLFLIAILFLVSPAPALAAATPWQDVAPGVRLRLISSDVLRPDGTTLVGIELDVPENDKTYWRLPGESGIPTEFDIAGSSGVRRAAIHWPYPRPELSNGYLDYVYHGQTVLPIELKTDAADPLLQAQVTMGVCSDVCVPVRASFSLPLSFASPDPGQSLRLQQAEALVPIPWNRSGAAFNGLAYDRATRTLRIGLSDPAVDPASVIVNTADPTIVFNAPQKSPDGRSIFMAMRGPDPGADWVEKPVQLTFMTASGSFEVSERVLVP